MKRRKNPCEHCGASMMEHKHSLSYHLIFALRKLAVHSGAMNIKHLSLTRNQWDNFQKLRYWRFVERIFDSHTGRRVSGVWKITQLGIDFLEGRISVPKSVWTYRGEFIRNEADFSFVSDIIDGYKLRERYASEARPHEGKTDGSAGL